MHNKSCTGSHFKPICVRMLGLKKSLVCNVMIKTLRLLLTMAHGSIDYQRFSDELKFTFKVPAKNLHLKMLSALGVCWICLLTVLINVSKDANSVDPDQTAISYQNRNI